MKTERYAFIFTKEEVRQYSELSCEQNPIYHSPQAAQELGYEGIPLPPAMPFAAYRHIEIPWTLKGPVIHRKQECRLHQVMYTDQIYTGSVTLTNHSSRHNRTFIQQDLEIYDEQENLCFTGISHLIAGGLNENHSL
ncbi:FAS1-like dehydratase domain-containing protein [Bacillus benzoevorans]|uniref:FAS1-like dehydratase domain-containing protein n=1 Tax=Bacillus benzoevorans TaxID=1456 RepID=A0A7X0HUS7_9BACI|nr:MaoC family dehydratase N-terminal domain-containing protein [Bacillus benzoevorans]MBB6447218.1 hypothetical protein [Bacillus benzoevorans]